MYKGHDPVKKTIYDISRKFLISNSITAQLLVDFGARHGESFEFLNEFCIGDYVFVEPIPKAETFIKRIIDTSQHRLHLINAAVTRDAGTMHMYTFTEDDDQSSNSFTDRDGRYGKSDIITVPTVSYQIFDQMFPDQQIDFAKINIEGSEYQMIEDGFFHAKIKSFVMELHNTHVKNRSWKDALKLLQDDFDITTCGDLGYKYCFMSGIRRE